MIKRIIPCLDISNNNVVKGINFLNISSVGNPQDTAIAYDKAGADELVILNIDGSVGDKKRFLEIIKSIKNKVKTPLIVGGGINTLDDIGAFLQSGADKISVNTAAIMDESLISRAAERYGSNRIVVAIDVKLVGGIYKVFISGGRKSTGIDGEKWAKRAEELGAGEILLTSMDTDGTRYGFNLDAINTVCKESKIPIIASGGAGKMEHFSDVFTKTQASGALAASLFHYQELEIDKLKTYLSTREIPVRMAN